MMIIVSLQHFHVAQLARGQFAETPLWLFMDVALIVAAITISFSYLIEISSVCLIDRVTGDQAMLMQTALKDAIAFAKEYGLPIPDSVMIPNA